MIKEAVSASDDTCLVVENSSRYDLKNRFGIVKNFGMRSVVDKLIAYPYWENAARITEDKSALLLVLQLVGLAVPAVTVTYLICKLVRNRKKLIKKAIDAIKRRYNNIKKRKGERPEKKKKQTSAAV